jgi:hypothetical protein
LVVLALELESSVVGLVRQGGGLAFQNSPRLYPLTWGPE